MILFDCDETLWSSEGKDYISSVRSDFIKVDSRMILRKADNKTFVLKKEAINFFKRLKKSDQKPIIGIISDNEPAEVITALELFGLWPFICKEAVNIKLWKGYCPKHQMVLEILNKEQFSHLFRQDVLWVDDKDYSKEAKEIGVNYSHTLIT